jgi:riboflavin kinase/FMN adenylyltransferase
VRVYADVDVLPGGVRLALTVGVFDGVHRGHQALLAATVRAARRHGAEPAVITFDAHPDLVLHGAAPPLLCDPAERLALLAEIGVSHLVVQHFDHAFASQTAEEFLARVCRGREVAVVVMAAGSAIGRGRAGTPEALTALGAREGFGVAIVPTLRLAGDRVSASRIRDLLTAGRLVAATDLLGRRPAVIGRVVEGASRGRDLGYRTANLAFDEPVALPPDGIYAVEASWDETAAPWGGSDPLSPRRCAGGVASLGVRPTFDVAGERLLEVHLFGVGEDLYGRRLRVAWVRRLRAERRFRSAAALVAQMTRDAARARAIVPGKPERMPP